VHSWKKETFLERCCAGVLYSTSIAQYKRNLSLDQTCAVCRCLPVYGGSSHAAFQSWRSDARDTICDLRKVATRTILSATTRHRAQPGNVDAAYHHGTVEVAKAFSKSQHTSTPLSGPVRGTASVSVESISSFFSNKISESSKRKTKSLSVNLWRTVHGALPATVSFHRRLYKI
jgi:hypothetical protein